MKADRKLINIYFFLYKLPWSKFIKLNIYSIYSSGNLLKRKYCLAYSRF